MYGGLVRGAVASALALTAVIALVPDVAMAGPPDTGRIALAPVRRMADANIPAETDWPIPATGILNIIVVSLAGDETVAIVHDCSTPAAGDDFVIHVEPGQPALRRAQLVAGVSWCLQTFDDVRVTIDQHGDLASTATAGGLQFRPLPAPQVVFDDLVPGQPVIDRPGGAIVALPRGASVPLADHLVYRIQTSSSDELGFLNLQDCSAVSGIPLSSDALFGPFPQSTTTYTDLSASGSPCLRLWGGAVRVRITVLGWLDANGPDGDSLPPVASDVFTAISGPGFVAVPPRRVLDTRNGIGATGKAGANSSLPLDLVDETTPLTTAVVLNVTVTQPDTGGYLTVWPCDEPRPTASNLNFDAGQTVPNLVNVRLSRDGEVCFFSTAPAHLLADLAGTFELADGSSSSSITPHRSLDTRVGLGAPATRVAAAQVLTVSIVGFGVPNGIDAVTMNLTVTEPLAAGYLTAWPCDEPMPVASNLNFDAGQTVPNLATVKVSAAGTVCLMSTAPTHLIADVQTWYGPAGENGYFDLTPARLLDTRNGIGGPVGTQAAGTPLHLQVAGREDVAATGVDSVTLNVTVTQPDGDGFVTVWPCDEPRPTASSLNFVTGQTVPNLINVKVAADGTVCLFSTRTTHLIADVAGYSSGELVPWWDSVLIDG